MRLSATALVAALFTMAFLASPAARAALPETGAPPIRVVVDPRIELMTIVFRLAGHVEYSYAEIASYARDVDAHFGRFKDHPAVVRARELRKTRGISFGDPMVLALNVTDPPELAERVPLDPFPRVPSSRWTPADARAFLADLRAFARDADAARFLALHDGLYRTAIERLETMLRESGLGEWVQGFFGRPDDTRYVIAISLLNASGSFGGLRVPSGRAAEDFYVVLGTPRADSNGLPEFASDAARTIAHEFSHSFVSPIVNAHLAELTPAAERIYTSVRNEMERQAYGPGPTIIHESLVRACTARYVFSHEGTEAGRRQVAWEGERGFLAVDGLAGLLGEYERERAKYPTLEAFATRIVAYLKEYSLVALEEAARVEAERRARMGSAEAPRVLSMSPENGAETVDAGSVTELTITFDRPMRHFAIVEVAGTPFPKVTGRPRYDETGRVLTIPCRLEPGAAYALQLNSEKNMVMTDERGSPLPPLLWRFRTRQ